ncbi:MAG: prepilin-type N-terminal cleavage/methylation domain-containing protein [Nitrospira sp.]|nr:prepilin-type N-terminal cleavage/methylation domain-containing protein [Nitrospira sp.]
MIVRNKSRFSNDGFTMIEIIAILTIISIMSVIAISKLTSTTSYNLISEADIVKSHLRYAQLRAMSDDVSWGINFSSTSYTLLKNGITATTNLPNESSPTHNLQSGLSITSGAGSTVSFDNWGSPGTSDKLITLSGSQTITVTKNTGFIQ